MKIGAVIFILLFANSNLMAETCVGRLSRLTNPTDNLINYLSVLVDGKILTLTNLSTWAETLKSGQFTNPFSSEKTQTDSPTLIHSQELKKYGGQKIDTAKLLTWVEGILTEKIRVQEERDKVSEATKDPHVGSILHLVSPGTFRKSFYSVPTTIPKAFRMMSTHVTHQQWLDVMNQPVASGSRRPTVNPDAPVENITWYSAVDFANRLSIRAGLKPVYDLSQLQATLNTTAANGSLSSKTGRCRINAPNEDIYQAEGYRLPTRDELDYVLYLAKAHQAILTGDTPNFKNNVWSLENSGGTSQPVAALPPFLVEGNHFFDLLGNVSHWVHHVDNLNPFGLEVASYGTSYAMSYRDIGSLLLTQPSNRIDTVGFRLVRTVK